MVKFGHVDNYIVAVWTPEDLEACADMNLPCANVSSLLPRPFASSLPEGKVLIPSPERKAGEMIMRSDNFTDLVPDFESWQYNTIMWTKPAVVRHLVEAGYAVHSSGE